MRKTMSILTLLLACWVAWGQAVLADGMILPLPEAMAADYLVVQYHHVTVSIEDNRAVTRVEQQFHNPYGVAVTGRYLFPLPPEAVLSRFEAEVDGQRQAVTHQDRETTRTQLRQSIVRQNDPSLLRYADWESLAFDLTLEPGSTSTMHLVYEEMLTPRGELYHYRYVLSTERYSSLPLEVASIAVEVSASPGLAALYSPSHQVSIQRLGPGRAWVHWDARDVRPGTDFELYFAATGDGFGGGLLTDLPASGNEGHFLFLFSPEIAPPPSATMPKDIVLVVDRSGSMSGEKIEQAQDALGLILGQLGEDDRFSLVTFSDAVWPLSDRLRPADSEALQDARGYVGRLAADGSTDLEAALQAALGILDRSEERGVPRMVVFLTDGLPTAGITDQTAIARRVAERNARLAARLHVFGVGYDVNTHLLDRLAADAGGTVTYVQPGEKLNARLTDFYASIAHPLLTDLQIRFEGLETSHTYPQALPDLFQGSSLLLSGRYRADSRAVTVRVRGRAGGEEREYIYRFDLVASGADGSGGTDFVARLWATRHVGALLDQVRVAGESEASVAEIRDLGLRYGIVTPYTTFAVEAQAAGAASAANMDLYDRADLNAASGQTTVQARVQNQMYQQAARADLATGANVSSDGRQSLAQVGEQQVDLALLVDRDLAGPLSPEWVEHNVKVDHTIEFGSDDYWDLAADPLARPYLQSGTNVVFAHGGKVVAVRGPEDGALAIVEGVAVGHNPAPANPPLANNGGLQARLAFRTWPRVLIAGVVMMALAGLAGLVAIAYWVGKSSR